MREGAVQDEIYERNADLISVAEKVVRHVLLRRGADVAVELINGAIISNRKEAEQ